jgi:hypothetical protein
LTSVTIGDSVTLIGNHAFDGCWRLTSVTIGSSVTHIGAYAFQGCTQLPSISMGLSVSAIGSFAFYKCTGLTSVSMNYSISVIGDYAFYGCTGLQNIYIPSTVTSIREGAFAYCSAMKKFIVDSGNELYASDESGALYNNNFSTLYIYPGSKTKFDIPKSVTTIGDYACYGCTRLNSISIPNTVTTIGRSAFYGCTDLTSIIFPSSVTSIGSFALNGCSKLNYIVSLATTPPTLTAPLMNADEYSGRLIVTSNDYQSTTYWNWISDITVISTYKPTNGTFEVDGLKYEYIGNVDVTTCRLYAIDESLSGDVVIPETVSYGGKVFTPVEISNPLIVGETSITSLTIPSNITTISSPVALCSSLAKLTVNTSVTSDLITGTSVDELVIGASVNKFSNDLNSNTIGKITVEYGDTNLYTAVSLKCSGLKEVYLGRNAFGFKDITSLEKVTMSDKVTSIGEKKFYGCTGLTSITIPSSVTFIDASAFEGCTGLTSVSFPGVLKDTVVKHVNERAFYGCTKLQAVYIEDLDVWGDFSFNYSKHGANPLYYAHHLYLNGEEVTEVSINPDHFGEIMPGTFDGCTGLTSVTIPNSVAYIDTYAFSGCTGLKSLKIPSSTQIIEAKAFEGCTNLGSITFEDGEDELTITALAFDGVTPTEVYFGRQTDFTRVPCSKLEAVEFGENVKSMADGAFSSAASLRSVTAHSDVPPTIGDATFASDTYTTGTLYVKDDAISSYKAADGWKNFCNVAAYDITDGINEVGNDNNTVNGTQVSVANGAICIAGDADVRIVSMNGTTIYNGRGNISVNVAPGIYVVLANGTATKVAVK